MKRSKKIKIVSLIFLILFSVYFQSVVFAAINATMRVSGDAVARSEADVRITGFKLGITLNATSNYEEFGKSHVTTEVNLTNSSSKIVYFLEITNYGSEDVGILNITGLPEGVNYSISNYNLTDKICDDNGNCNGFIKQTYELTLTTASSYSGNIKLDFDFRTYHKVTYTGITNNNYPTEVIDGGNLNITFVEDLEDVLISSNEVELGFYDQIINGQTISLSNITNDVEVKIKTQVAKLVSGNIDEIGSEVCINDECFYIIKNDGSTVTMLAKYNLYVGNECSNASESSCLPYDSPTGKQDSTILGYPSDGGYPRKGTLKFMASSYSSTVADGTYIFDSSSNLYEHVENYKAYLKSQGATLKNVRLIKKEEVESLGCKSSSVTCSGAPSWVYSTSYWTGTAYNKSYMWSVFSDNYYNYTSITNGSRFGVRPVIEMDVSEIYIPPIKIVSGNLNTVGSEVCIKDECFYIISNDGSTLKMFAKYNLLIGNKWTGPQLLPLENPTGLQDKTAIGWFAGRSESNPVIGGIEFYPGKTAYWESTVTSFPTYVYNSSSTIYSYFENYKQTLINYGVDISNIRLIDLNELTSLGCSTSSETCTTSSYSWLYSTTYWTGSASNNYMLWNVMSDGGLTGNFLVKDFGSNDVIETDSIMSLQYGARPVIELQLDKIRL